MSLWDRPLGLDFGGTFPPSPPSTYHDPASGITVYVESDGRHLAAIDKQGRILWVRNPFVDINMCPYRTAHPYIHLIDAVHLPPTVRDPNGWIANMMNKWIDLGSKLVRPGRHPHFIYIGFNSSQFGYVDLANGNFYPVGQN